LALGIDAFIAAGVDLPTNGKELQLLIEMVIQQLDDRILA
jgi:hypothetical protein